MSTITAGGSYNLSGSTITLTTTGLLSSADTFAHNYSLDFTAAATPIDLSTVTLAAPAGGSISITTGVGSGNPDRRRDPPAQRAAPSLTSGGPDPCGRDIGDGHNHANLDRRD